MQKISSIHEPIFTIQQILELIMATMPILIMATLKSLKYLLAFLNLHQYSKNQFILSIHSWIPWPGRPRSFLNMPTQKSFDQLLVYKNL